VAAAEMTAAGGYQQQPPASQLLLHHREKKMKKKKKEDIDKSCNHDRIRKHKYSKCAQFHTWSIPVRMKKTEN
jgi:hypothetical protein